MIFNNYAFLYLSCFTLTTLLHSNTLSDNSKVKVGKRERTCREQILFENQFKTLIFTLTPTPRPCDKKFVGVYYCTNQFNDINKPELLSDDQGVSVVG